MAPITRFSSGDAVAEKSTAEYRAVLKDQDGAAIEPGAVSSMTVTLSDASGTVVNSRSAQNCLNTGDGVLAAGGVFTFTIQPADTALVAGAELQKRILTFHVVFSGGELRHEADFYVRNLISVS
jgi:hypothetical protein